MTPEENFSGEFSISYNVDDGNGGLHLRNLTLP
ncbi:cadherin-like domain-containing protein [Vibrio lentus]|nr:cadherin-like domain-containing protein [Vibrio lentus]